MKRRIFTGWNFRRIMYVVLGIVVIGESVSLHTWMGILLGAYFAAMGVFAFGCASGNCMSGRCRTPFPEKKNEIKDVTYTEVK